MIKKNKKTIKKNNISGGRMTPAQARLLRKGIEAGIEVAPIAAVGILVVGAIKTLDYILNWNNQLYFLSSKE